MVAESEPIESVKNINQFAVMSFILGMVWMPCELLMVFISMIGYYAWNWHNLDNIIAVFITFTLPLLISGASVVTGIKFFTIKGGYRKDILAVIMVVVGLFFGILELGLTVFLSVLYMSN